MQLSDNFKNIRKVAVIDDNRIACEAMAEVVEDANLEPMPYQGRLESINDFIPRVMEETDAAIFDHRLKPGNYADFDGAEAVSHLYKKKFPALLVTTYFKAEIDAFRLYRRDIPVLIPADKANSEKIIEGIKKCLDEFSYNYSKDRRAWRTLIRIEEIDKDVGIAFAYIPAWNPDEVVRIPLKLIPEELLAKEPIFRLFAYVNIGAKNYEDLYFEKFEIADKPRGKYARLLHS
ncbi:MAG: hypothetical protein KAT34_11795 [Candidatus Aminicenantes bacterium]|nr:hypothetical protein [Candidatus Aminicenantes bacterium]